MPKRSSKPKRPRDANQLAKAIADAATGQTPIEPPQKQPEKNPAAVALGRLGGLKGGKARADSLSRRRRQEIARAAAKTRWAAAAKEKKSAARS